MLFRACVLSMVVVATPVIAATQSVTLHVPGMDCPVCPLTIKTALGRVDGVLGTRVDYESRQVHVTYDDARTGVDALRDATRNAGFPSSPMKALK